MRIRSESIRAKIKRSLGSFAGDCRGAAIVEFAAVLPVIVILMSGALVMKDRIRMGYLNSKASYTLADMVSREDESIDAPYFEGLDSVFEYLVDGRYPTDLRITTIECTADCTDQDTRTLEVCWSQASSDFPELTTMEIANYNARTPLFAEGDTLVMTETFLDYTPLVFNSVFDPKRYEAITFTRPRVAGQIKFDTGELQEDGNPAFEDCFNNDI